MTTSGGRNFAGASALLFLGVVLLLTAPAGAAVLDVWVGNTNTVIRREVKSVLDLRFRNVVKQNTDYSCGAAALATLLTYYFGEEISEEAVLNDILGKADEDTLKRVMTSGLSLLDLKNFAEALGFRGKGYRLERTALEKLDRPAIGLVNLKGYNHFVVITAVDGEKVYMADPAKGNTVRDIGEFMGMWNRIILVFENKGEKIQSHDLVTGTTFNKKKADFVNDRVDLGFALDPGEF